MNENPEVVQTQHRRKRRRKGRTVRQRILKVGFWILFFAAWSFFVTKATRYFGDKGELGKKIKPFEDVGQDLDLNKNK